MKTHFLDELNKEKKEKKFLTSVKENILNIC